MELDTQNTTPVWGLAGTLIWFLAIGFVFVAGQSLIMGFYLGSSTDMGGQAPTAGEMTSLIENLQFDGNVVAMSVISTGIICSLMTLLAIRAKKGASIKSYLGFAAIDQAVAIQWISGFLILLGASELLSILLGKETVSQYMLSIYQSASSLGLLWLAIVVIGPVFEEIFFRGFILTGLSQSIIGPMGAIVITATVWAAIHTQYELYYVVTILILGLVLGACKLKTGNLLLPVVIHMLVNFLAILQTHFHQLEPNSI